MSDHESDNDFVADDPQEMFENMVEIAKSEAIRNLVESRLRNNGDDLDVICEEGFKSLQEDSTIVGVVF